MESFTIFLIASIALIVTPGPDIIYVLTRGIADGKRSGAVSASHYFHRPQYMCVSNLAKPAIMSMYMCFLSLFLTHLISNLEYEDKISNR